MSFINPTVEFKRHELGEGFFLGTVKDNEDPKKLGRARVRVPEVHGTQSPDDLLPWASPLRPLYRGGKGRNGYYSRPDVDSRVAIIFHKGCIYSPFYFAEPRSMMENESIETEGDRLEPGDTGFDSIGGEWFSITEEGVTKFVHRSGTQFKIDKDGAVLLDIDSGENFRIRCGSISEFYMDSSEILMNAGHVGIND